MKTLSCLLLSMGACYGATVYSIDINDADAPLTTSGWTGLNSPHSADGGAVTVDGVEFRISSSDGSRLRGSPSNPAPDSLVGDFAFDEGAANSAIILHFGQAGSLVAGDWLVEVWSYDSGSSVGTQMVGYRRNGTETIVHTDVEVSASGPAASFTFSSDGVGAYDVFLRENSSGNKTRLNAVRLTLIPEPSTASLFGLAGVALLLRRQRRCLSEPVMHRGGAE
ncbi:PEP-CTERM sorting domain-containing protein [Verrucomicrobiaceae bacterium N1E253]|uniref:PEP-CTERM sorting domain-containing protein n=1 Tax=Oceaniferula marina TaxID=2748318 RepID=A0A851GDY5_9BACT|nr:PEP-CTERM sorting domain-containing protein [Oceaniferula marina]NWK55763.1 PEP-CTERM sorting domain-containing protein [Oceaniferula marina]